MAIGVIILALGHVIEDVSTAHAQSPASVPAIAPNGPYPVDLTQLPNYLPASPLSADLVTAIRLSQPYYALDGKNPSALTEIDRNATLELATKLRQLPALREIVTPQATRFVKDLSTLLQGLATSGSAQSAFLAGGTDLPSMLSAWNTNVVTPLKITDCGPVPYIPCDRVASWIGDAVSWLGSVGNWIKDHLAAIGLILGYALAIIRVVLEIVALAAGLAFLAVPALIIGLVGLVLVAIVSIYEYFHGSSPPSPPPPPAPSGAPTCVTQSAASNGGNGNVYLTASVTCAAAVPQLAIYLEWTDSHYPTQGPFASATGQGCDNATFCSVYFNLYSEVPPYCIAVRSYFGAYYPDSGWYFLGEHVPGTPACSQ